MAYLYQEMAYLYQEMVCLCIDLVHDLTDMVEEIHQVIHYNVEMSHNHSLKGFCDHHYAVSAITQMCSCHPVYVLHTATEV